MIKPSTDENAMMIQSDLMRVTGAQEMVNSTTSIKDDTYVHVIEYMPY